MSVFPFVLFVSSIFCPFLFQVTGHFAVGRESSPMIVVSFLRRVISFLFDSAGSAVLFPPPSPPFFSSTHDFSFFFLSIYGPATGSESPFPEPPGASHSYEKIVLSISSLIFLFLFLTSWQGWLPPKPTPHSDGFFSCFFFYSR